MDSRSDFQRLLEDMDRVIQSKRLELRELDERLELSRKELAQREAKELANEQLDAAEDANRQVAVSTNNANQQQQEQQLSIRRLYEQQLKQFGDELTELETLNQELAGENELLRRQLLASRSTGDSLQAAKAELEAQLVECRSANLELNLRLAKAESELSLQEKLLLKSNREDQVLMDAFNSKLESLKRAIEARDREIRRLREDNRFVLNSFDSTQTTAISKNHDYYFQPSSNNMDTDDDQMETSFLGSSCDDKSQSNRHPNGEMNAQFSDSTNRQRLLNIINSLRQKDSQILALKSQLLQATRDLKQNCSPLISDSNADCNADDKRRRRQQVAVIGDQSAIEVDSTPDQRQVDHQVELLNRLKMLENEMEAKDKQVTLMEFQIHHYETILPNKIGDLINNLLSIIKKVSQYNELTALPFEHQLKSASNNSDNFQSNEQQQQRDLNNETLNRNKLMLISQLNECVEILRQASNGLNLTRGLMDQIDHLKSIILARETQIKSLVDELNQMDAKFSLVQQQCDLLRSTSSGSLAVDERAAEAEAGDHEKPGSSGSSAGESQLNSGVDTRRRVRFLDDDSSTPREDNGRFKSVDEIPTNESSPRTDLGPAECQEAAQGSVVDITVLAGPSITAAAGSSSLPVETTAAKMSEQQPNGSTNSNQLQQVETTNESERDGIMMESNQQATDSTAIGKGEQSESNGSQNNSNNNRDNCSNWHEQLESIDSKAHGERLSQLEAENELLELAMKEILMALRWCDSSCSTILIDSPSLERLCQLIEARYLATPAPNQQPPSGGQQSMVNHETDRTNNSQQQLLFQMIVLKSELDLLRGQNEQLRADLKAQRRDYHALLDHSFRSRSGSIEAGSQTEQAQCKDMESSAAAQVSVGAEGDQPDAGSSSQENRCTNCSRLLQLTDHLMQCIVRIETRVQISDETNLNRLVQLGKLNRTLERDLAARERLLAGLRRECHLITQQKLLLSARLQFIEAQMSVRQPEVADTTSAQGSNGSAKVQLYTSLAQNGTNSNSIQRLTIQSGVNGPTSGVRSSLRNTRLTISLLQSIIGCLQARIDYKDERLKQMEQLISGQQQQAQ